jgi:uncharacterized protein YegP (UPF0339 family)
VDERRPAIKVYPSTDGQHYYVVEAANGEVLVTSETFTRVEGAVEGAKALIRAVVGSQLTEPIIIRAEAPA